MSGRRSAARFDIGTITTPQPQFGGHHRRMATATRKLIYTFPEGNATMRALLGGKGAGLAEMTNAGLPVPPGFTITTEACNAYYAAGRQLPPGLWDDVLAHMAD